jgi:hypothetical protein
MGTPEALTILNVTDTVFWELHYAEHETTLRKKNLLPPSSGKKLPYTIHALHNPSYYRLHTPLQSDFSGDCDLVIPLSVSSILFLTYDHSVAAYVLFLVFPSHLSSLH